PGAFGRSLAAAGGGPHGSHHRNRPDVQFQDLRIGSESMRRLVKVGVAAIAGLASFAFAGPAWAHITVDPSTAPKGAEVTLGFRVPNEEATVSTVKVQIFFPSDHPILGVDPEKAPGWTDQVHLAPL